MRKLTFFLCQLYIMRETPVIDYEADLSTVGSACL
jgi:hypothetical protein